MEVRAEVNINVEIGMDSMFGTWGATPAVKTQPPTHILPQYQREEGGAGMHWKGRRYAPPSRAPCLCPATVSQAASARFNGICNRQ